MERQLNLGCQQPCLGLLPVSLRALQSQRRKQQTCQKATRGVVHLTAQPLTSGSFAPFGQVIVPTQDGKEFDGEDAQLRLGEGVPRLYIMTLPNKGMTFDRITHHARVTQCLCGMGPDPWYLAVAQPTESVQQYPQQEDLVAFKISPSVFVKLHQSTWHAGPFFKDMPSCNFANLELSDTNVSDHNTHVYAKDSSDIDAFSILDEA